MLQYIELCLLGELPPPGVWVSRSSGRKAVNELEKRCAGRVLLHCGVPSYSRASITYNL